MKPIAQQLVTTQPETNTSSAEERAQELRYEALNLLAHVLIQTPRPSDDVCDQANDILDRLDAEATADRRDDAPAARREIEATPQRRGTTDEQCAELLAEIHSTLRFDHEFAQNRAAELLARLEGGAR